MMKSAFIVLLATGAIASCDAFAPKSRRAITKVSLQAASLVGEQAKSQFLESLDEPYDLNQRSETRTQLVNDIIDKCNGITNPGSQESFAAVAPGVWRVVYAPHMTIMAGLFQGEFSVQVRVV